MSTYISRTKWDDLINEQHRIGTELAERELVEQGRTD
jgi:hypothetical protein